MPGKVILMGEHAAVYGRPAVVAAVDCRLHVEARVGLSLGGLLPGEPLPGGPSHGSAARRGVRLDLPDIGVAEEHSWLEVEEFAAQARRKWQAFAAGERPFEADRDRAALVRVAVGEALASLPARDAKALRERSLALRLQSALRVGAGLGSSAAAAVGVIAATRAAAFLASRPSASTRTRPGNGAPGQPTARSPMVAPAAVDATAVDAAAMDAAAVDAAELAAIECAALEVERRQHGFPSGIDSGTVIRGGILLVRRFERPCIPSSVVSPRSNMARQSPSSRLADRAPERSRCCREGEALRFDELPRREWLRRGVLVVDSGTPEQTTGAVVAAVRRRHENDPVGVAKVLDRIGAAAEVLREALVADRRDQAVAAVAAGHRGLVDLGVVPPAVARRIARVEAAGGAAKISGAGALDGESAGAILCLPGRRGHGLLVDGLRDLPVVDAPLGVDGLRFEPAETVPASG